MVFLAVLLCMVSQKSDGSPLKSSHYGKKFTKQVTERSVLVVYGYLTHVSLDVIEWAIKLPPHVTDELKPLDVCKSL